MSLEQIAEQGPAEGDSTSPESQTRDYEAEARSHGWTPKEDFKGDATRWVDAETFVKRADEVMPFLKKQNQALKRELDDLKKQTKRAADFFSKSEERAYNRAMSDLQAKMDEAVETGDVAASRKVMKDMTDLKADFETNKLDTPEPVNNEPQDVAAFGRRINEWIADSDWYQVDDKKTRYADLQSNDIIREHGALHSYPGGLDAALKEIEKRVDRKFSERPPAQTNGGGNRSGGAANGGRSFADLPPDAKKMCDKWVAQKIIKSREDYVKSYQW